jgi:hypothetical protein
MFRRSSSEHGAVFIHVAIGLLVLLAFGAFVMDYGMLWVSRSQVQAAADAGALAGAVALAHDNVVDRADRARNVAWNTGIRTRVWGDAPGIVPTSPYDGPGCGTAGQNSCVRVDAFRDGSNGSTLLPTFLANLFGLSTQHVKAMAVARAGVGNSTTCLKPWAVVDKWTEHYPTEGAPWDQTSMYDKYIISGSNKGQVDPAIPIPDSYVAPTDSSVGTGFHPYNPDGSYTPDYGRQLTLKAGQNSNDFAFGSGWFMALSLGGSCGTGGACYNENIKNCVGIRYSIGEEVPVDTEPGDMVGPTRQAVATDTASDGGGASLVNQDPGAHWDEGTQSVQGSAFSSSPRIVAIPLVNPDEIAQAQAGGRTTVKISNIAGFFIEGMAADNKGVVGRLVNMPALEVTGAGNIDPNAAFLYVIQLVR